MTAVSRCAGAHAPAGVREVAPGSVRTLRPHDRICGPRVPWVAVSRSRLAELCFGPTGAKQCGKALAVGRRSLGCRRAVTTVPGSVPEEDR
jgi:hypothetical protein